MTIFDHINDGICIAQLHGLKPSGIEFGEIKTAEFRKAIKTIFGVSLDNVESFNGLPVTYGSRTPGVTITTLP